MANTDIGGLFVKLGLHTDKPSFETGNKAIDLMTSATSKLIGTVRNAGAAMVAMAAVSGTVENSSIKTAAKLGLATEQLNMWKAAAQLAGSSSDGLVASMSKLNDAIVNRTIDGKGLAEIAKYYEMLGGNDFEKLLTMNSSDAFAEFMRVAMESDDILRTAELLNRALGTGAQEFYLMLKESGSTLDQMLNKANATQFTTNQDARNGKGFRDELTTLKLESESIGKLFGDSIGKEITPLLKELNNWIQENGDDIKEAIENIAEMVGRIADKVAPIFAGATKALTGAINGNEEQRNEGGEEMGLGVAALLTGNNYSAVQKSFYDRVAVNEMINKIWQENINAHPVKGKLAPYLYKPSYDELPEDLKKSVDLLGGPSSFSNIKDGIIRPNGQITQVAPDDWVFAARNLGDLAAAFIPQNYAGAELPNTYSIVQNFTISGNGNIGQMVRQQAYNGTRDGLMQAAAQSSKRLQMMSGTR